MTLRHLDMVSVGRACTDAMRRADSAHRDLEKRGHYHGRLYPWNADRELGERVLEELARRGLTVVVSDA